MTTGEITYGFEVPGDVYEKLLHDGEKIDALPHRFDLFDFFVTAAVLYEWVKQHHLEDSVVGAIHRAFEEKSPDRLPELVNAWITDTTCIPNRRPDIRRDIFNAVSICWTTANATKHCHWRGNVTAIEDAPVIKDFYQYCFTSVEPGIRGGPVCLDRIY